MKNDKPKIGLIITANECSGSINVWRCILEEINNDVESIVSKNPSENP